MTSDVEELLEKEGVWREAFPLIDSLTLYKIGKILKLSTEGSKGVVKNDAFSYAFRYSSTIDYSPKRFDCSQAKMAKRFFDSQSDKIEVISYILEMKRLLDDLDTESLEQLLKEG